MISGMLTKSEYLIELTQFLIVCLIIAEYWDIFRKSGERGWKAFIPLYGTYIKFKIAKRQRMFCLFLISEIVFMSSLAFLIYVFMFMALEGISGIDETTTAALVSGVLTIASFLTQLFCTFRRCISTAELFGKTKGFGVGMVFVEVIFVGILAFGSAKYMNE